MNSNGAPIQNNLNIDCQRGTNGGGQSGKYRNNPKRSRGRASQDKTCQYRNYDKKSSNLRENSHRHVVDVIDIHDNSQWPSIEESSMRSSGKVRSTVPISTPISSQTDRTIGASQNDRNISHENRSNQYQSETQQSGYYNAPNREYMSRYPPLNRGRAGGSSGRYNRGYLTGNTNRRYIRTAYPGYRPMYPSQDHALMFNGPVMFPTYAPIIPEGNVNDIDPVKQVEYYFSVHNLESDFYIRSQMDDQGWVPLITVYKFKRIQTLEISFEDFVNCLLYSQSIEIDQERKRIRTKVDPQKWVLTQHQKDTSYISKNVAPASQPSYVGGGVSQGMLVDTNSTNPQSCPFPNFTPLIFPMSSSNLARVRYVPSQPPPPPYAIYSNTYYGVPYSGEIQFDNSIYPQYFPTEYYGSYNNNSENSQIYFTSNEPQKQDLIDETYSDSSSSLESPVNTNISVEKIDDNANDQIHNLSKKISEFEISHQ